ncbi:MAG TPA: DUF4157 domain-containing protein [Pyrinomonadaceae bacterium]|nr:DUF4157 domain-containing protein [Pyrinomonadaceae bacterium]
MSAHAPAQLNQHMTQIRALSAVQPLVTNSRWLQRKCACGSYGVGECDKCRNQGNTLQRSATTNDSPLAIPSIVNDVLNSPSQPLDAGTRGRMEPLFGHDFSTVRVHTDAKAEESAQAVNALAYTVGRDMVFGAGQYAPETRSGQQLMAHELTHVIQQSASSSGQMLRMGEPNSAAEVEADQLSNTIMQGGNVDRPFSHQGMSLQRQASSSATSQPPSPATSSQPATQPAAPSVPERATASNIRINGFGNFDAEFDRRAALTAQRRPATEPCRLVLNVRVKFNFNDTQTPSRWTPTEQNRWTSEFIRVVTNRWSFRFLLGPGQACASEPCQSAAAILHIEPVASSPHHTVNVDYTKPEEARSDIYDLYRPDVERGGSDLRTSHATATHEAGHMLGLEHVHCNTDDDQCYGTNREESADIMGRGEIVTERDYMPFVTAMNLLSTCTWRVRNGQRGPLFRNVSTGLGITLGAAGAFAGVAVGIALGGGVGGAIAGGLLGGGLGALIGYGFGSLAD